MFSDILNDFSYKMWILLGQTKDAISMVRENDVRKHNLPLKQVTVMGLIDLFGDEATISELSRWLLRKPNTLLELINRMQKNGLIEIKRDLERKGKIRIILTKKGRSLYKRSIQSNSIPTIMSALTETECQQLIKCLCKIRAKALELVKLPYEAKLPPF